MNILQLGTDSSGAIFSPCKKWRYALWREIVDAPLLTSDAHGDCVFVGLNPSVADEAVMDLTCTICRNYAAAWGHRRYVMLNLFGWRDTDPKGMKAAIEPIGELNSHYLREFCSKARTIICAWGTHGSYLKRAATVLELLKDFDLYCLELTKGGHPHHPTRLEIKDKPTLWRAKS
jgi:hypothetical protein